MEELRLMVADETANHLRTTSELTGMPMGPLLDHLMLNLAPKSPDAATVLIMEKILMSISNLGEKEAAQVCGTILGAICQNIPPEELDSIVSDVKKVHMSGDSKIEVMSKEDMDAFRKKFQGMIQILFSSEKQES